MAHIVEICNPFNPFDVCRRQHAGGVTIRALLHEMRGPLFVDFEKPTICQVNGEAVMRGEWSKYRIKENDIVSFVTFPGEPITILYWVYAIVLVALVVVALTQTIPKPGVPGSTPEPDPTYTLSGQRNQIRLGAPIECPYGKCRLWPSYAARPYNKFINNDQYQYQLFCLGHGRYDIDKIQIEDTLIANFQDVDYEIYEPGEEVVLFPDNVITSTEVGGIELFGANQEEYTGISGPFTANGSGTLTNKLEVDISLPAGLYIANNATGKLGPAYIAIRVEYRPIDDDGIPTGGGDWHLLEYFERTLATNTPQRYTLEKGVDPARYEVRAVRANGKNIDTNSGNVGRWDALRAFLPSTKDYGNVTLLAMRARATNNLNDRASNRLNIIATRMLRTRVDGAWTDLVPTRSPVWAFADTFQAPYGGRLADQFLDIAALEALDAIFVAAGWNFDFVFDQRGTCWDQAKVIARCGRAIPMLEGSRITMIRDYPKSVATAPFNHRNIVQGSFKWDIKMANIDEFDGLEVEYVDPDTFLPETVKCLVDDDAGDNCEQIRFPGCTDRTHAYREGMYMRASKLKLVENITFQTELEGQIPSYGDMILVVHDLPKWGQGGLLVDITGGNLVLTLSEPVTFGVGTHKIAFRKKNGDVVGPLTCTVGSTPTEVILDTPLDPGNYFFDNLNELPLFFFGKANENGTLCTIVGLTPSSDNTVEIKAVVYDGDIFAADGATAPAFPPGRVPDGPPDIPTMNCAAIQARLDPIDENRVKVSWSPAYGALRYNVQRSADGTTWSLAGTTIANELTIDTTPGEVLHIRIQPVGRGAGAWCSMGGGSTGTQPGDGNPVPPPPPLEYPDLVPYEILIPSAASITSSCKTRGGSTDMKGCPEYTAPSLPPRYYRRAQASGHATARLCAGGPDVVECVYSGFVQYDRDTGLPSYGGETNCGGSVVGTGESCGVAADGCGYFFTRTQTEQTRHFTADCCSGVVGTSDLFKITLSDEDSEDDALARLEATLPAWEDISWSTCVGTASVWTVRGAGEATLTKVEAKQRFQGSLYYANWDYTLTVEFERSSDGITWVASDTIEYTISANLDGEFDEHIDYPITQGYTTRVKRWTFGP